MEQFYTKIGCYRHTECRQHQVKDQNWNVALFNEMGSSPANMQAGKAVDSHGLQRDYTVEQADAEAAYTQCELKGTETWVRLPEDRWPDEWFTKDNGHKVFKNSYLRSLFIRCSFRNC